MAERTRRTGRRRLPPGVWDHIEETRFHPLQSRVDTTADSGVGCDLDATAEAPKINVVSDVRLMTVDPVAFETEVVARISDVLFERSHRLLRLGLTYGTPSIQLGGGNRTLPVRSVRILLRQYRRVRCHRVLRL